MKKILLTIVLLLSATTSAWAVQQVINPTVGNDDDVTARWTKGNANFTELYGLDSFGITSSNIAGWNAKVGNIIGDPGITVTGAGTEKTIAIDTSYAQRRVSGTCGAGYAISTVNENGTVTCESTGTGGGSTTFLGLTDTPSSYTANYWVKVNSGGTALELVTAPSGGGDVYVSGTPTAGQIALWTDATTIEGSSTIDVDIVLADEAPTATGQITYDGTNDALRVYDGSAVDTYSSDNAIAAVSTIDATGFNGNLATTDDTIQEVAQALDDLSAGSAAPWVEQASDPTYDELSTGDKVVATGSGDLFYKSATGLYVIPGVYTVDPASVDYAFYWSGDSSNDADYNSGASTTATVLGSFTRSSAAAYAGANGGDTITETSQNGAYFALPTGMDAGVGSVSMWINVQTWSADRRIIPLGSSVDGTNYMALSLGGTGNVYMRARINGTYHTTSVIASGVAGTGSWFKAVLRWDLDNDIIKIETSSTTATNSTVTSDWSNTPDRIYVGQGDTTGVDAYIDEVYVYDTYAGASL